MARIRSVHPGLFTDETFMELSAYAQVFIIGLWTEADDQGVFPWKPKTLKARLLPAASVDAEALLQELVDGGVLGRFEVSGQAFGVIRNFRKFQRPEKPKAVHPLPDEWREFVGLSSNSHTCSRKPQQPIGGAEPTARQPIPAPPPTSSGVVAEPLPSDPEPIGDESPTDPRLVGDQSATTPRFEGPMEDGGGRMEEEIDPPSLPSEARSPLAGPAEPEAAARGSRLPLGWKPNAELRAFAEELGLDPAAIADRFGDYWRSKAGKDARKTDWSAVWRNWCRRTAEETGGRQLRPGPGGGTSRPGQPDLDWMHAPGAVESLLQ